MKALVFNGKKDISYESFEDPKLNSQANVIVQINACSICGSDLHIYHGGKLATYDYSQPMPRFCVGHEGIGEIVEVGKDVRSHQVGDKVLMSAGIGCGQCDTCLAGAINLCKRVSNAGCYGIDSELNGCQAELLEAHNADITVSKIPEGVSDEQALLLTDALATGYYGVKMTQVNAGDTVVVIGQGPVGRMAAEAAIAIGASRVYCIDPVEHRRDSAALFEGVGLHPDEAVNKIREDTKGLGVDCVIEAVGRPETINMSIKLARPGGRVSILGMMQAGSRVPMEYAQAKSLTVHAGLSGIVNLWPELIPLVSSGKIKGEGVFTHEFSMSEGAAAYEMFSSQADNVTKILITP